jgi:hypothetical protein
MQTFIGNFRITPLFYSRNLDKCTCGPLHTHTHTHRVCGCGSGCGREYVCMHIYHAETFFTMPQLLLPNRLNSNVSVVLIDIPC